MGRINNQITNFITGMLGKIRLKSAKDEDQNVFRQRYSNFKDFAYHWKNSFSRASVPVNSEITFSNYFGFGSNMEFIKRLIGKPVISLENKEFDTIILMYMINVHGFNVHFELHFYEGKLFNISYRYKSVTEEEKQQLISALLEKYGISPVTDIGNSILVDPHGNALMFEDGQQFSVNYLSPNSRVMELANQYSEHRAV